MPAPADIYQNEVDFTTLALQFPDFASRLKANGQLDFSDPESVRQLTKSLLSRDFDIQIDLPEDRLCPPVPNRFNYILFIQKLLDSTSSSFRETYDSSRRVLGFDIGTGASAIYPLLGCRQRPEWLFIATEVDEKSYNYAKRNIQTNRLESRIKLLKVNESDTFLLPEDVIEKCGDIDFVMTNPPFYSSESSMVESAKLKSRPPNSSCTGAPIEMITPGGEEAFIGKLISDSLIPANKSNIQWFSTMLGKLSSVSSIVNILRERGCTNYAVTELLQGQKTRRWCVAWSWKGLRPPINIARGIPGFEKKLLPFPSEFEFQSPLNNVRQTSSIVDKAITALDLQWQFKSSMQVGVGLSEHGDVWSRKARRKKQQKDSNGAEVNDEEMNTVNEDLGDDDDEKEPALVFKITITQQPGESGASTVIQVRWLQGQDAVLFESFCGWIKRKVEAGMQ